MKKETKETLLSSVNSVLYAQIERLLKYVSQNMQGHKLTILYFEGYASTDCLFKHDDVRVGFEATDKEYIVITLGHLKDDRDYEISLTVFPDSTLYYHIPKSIILGLHKSLKLKQGFPITVHSELKDIN